MNRKKPQISMHLNKNESALDVFIKADVEECDVNGFLFTDETVEHLNISDVEISGCIFINCRFYDCIFEGVSFSNCIFKNCDLSFMNMTQGSIACTEIIESNISGLNLTFGVMNHVLIKSTACRYVNFSEVRMMETDFVACDMTSGNIDRSRLKETRFVQCDLTGADFAHTSLNGMDLRGNRLDRIVFLGGELEGTTIDYGQAIALVKLLGIEVVDNRGVGGAF